ncbi:Helicase [uncultured virus]|nr:Helicase [uncultured virus]
MTSQSALANFTPVLVYPSSVCESDIQRKQHERFIKSQKQWFKTTTNQLSLHAITQYQVDSVPHLPDNYSTNYTMPNSNHLTNSSPTILQPTNVQVKLYQHQLAAIHRIRSIEVTKQVQVSPIKAISSNVAFLVSCVGSGKTFIAIGLVATQQVSENCTVHLYDSKLMYHKTYRTSSYRDDPNDQLVIIRSETIPSDRIRSSNLFIVPDHLVNQWLQEFSKTNLKYCEFTGLADLPYCTVEPVDEIDVNETNTNTRTVIYSRAYEQGSLVLGKTILDRSQAQDYFANNNIVIAYSFVKLFRKYVDDPDVYWSRVIVDDFDADSKNQPFHALFYLYLNADSNIFADDHEELLVINDSTFVNQSLQLPVPRTFVINTILPKHIQAVSEYMPSSVLELINAGNLQQAITQLNCGTCTNDNIISVLIAKTQDTITNLKAKKEYTLNRILPPQDKQARLLKLDNEINRLTTDITNITDRVTQALDGSCFICLDVLVMPTVVNCCNNVYCFECIQRWLLSCQSKCPVCRKIIDVCNVQVIQGHSSNSNSRSLEHTPVTPRPFDKYTALTCLLDHIEKQDPSPSIIISSNHHDTFAKIKMSSSLVAVMLDQVDHIDQAIEQFTLGNINILMLNSSQYAKGLNIPTANYAILFHETTRDIEMQVIGRAQRPGRTGPLTIFYLRDTNEGRTFEYSDGLIQLDSEVDITNLALL